MSWTDLGNQRGVRRTAYVYMGGQKPPIHWATVGFDWALQLPSEPRNARFTFWGVNAGNQQAKRRSLGTQQGMTLGVGNEPRNPFNFKETTGNAEN